MVSPTKTDAQLLGIRGERAFLSELPNTWGYLKHDADFGIDVMLEVWSEDKIPKLIGRDIAVQIKSHSGFPAGPARPIQRERSISRLRGELFYERLKRSTLEYLAGSNAFLASIYFEETRLDFRFSAFREILPGTLSALRLLSPTPDWLVCITPLRSIASGLLERNKSAVEVRIPIHPLNFCEFINSRRVGKDGESDWRSRDIVYDRSPGANPDTILHNRWAEVVADSIVGPDFDTICKIRYTPFIESNPTKALRDHARRILMDSTLAPRTVWLLFECVIAGFFFKMSDLTWLTNVLDLKSEFFSLLTLRLFRYQHATLTPDAFATYLKGCAVWPRVSHPIPRFAADPFNCLHGKTSIREYYDEGCGYLVHLIDTDPGAARDTILRILKHADRTGANELFGQMVAAFAASPLPEFVRRLIADDLGATWDSADDAVTDAIRALNAIDIICLDFSPLEK